MYTVLDLGRRRHRYRTLHPLQIHRRQPPHRHPILNCPHSSMNQRHGICQCRILLLVYKNDVRHYPHSLYTLRHWHHVVTSGMVYLALFHVMFPIGARDIPVRNSWSRQMLPRPTFPTQMCSVALYSYSLHNVIVLASSSEWLIVIDAHHARSYPSITIPCAPAPLLHRPRDLVRVANDAIPWPTFHRDY